MATAATCNTSVRVASHVNALRSLRHAFCASSISSSIHASASPRPAELGPLERAVFLVLAGDLDRQPIEQRVDDRLFYAVSLSA